MINKYLTISILFVLCIVCFLGDAPRSTLTVLAPIYPDSLAFDQGQLFLISAPKEQTAGLLISTQWSVEKLIDISNKTNKDNFAKEVFKLFPPKSTLELVSTSFLFYNGFSKADSVNFSYTDTVTVRSFWQLPQFAEIINQVQNISASHVLLHIRGWKDTVYTSTHLDPLNPDQILYYTSIQLLPGVNRIYFADNGNKNDSKEFYIRFVSDARSSESREAHFHGSQLASTCATCHEELPGEVNAQGLRENCGLCHTQIAGGLVKHGPAAEPKDCSVCHERSAEKNIEIVAKGVPGVCYDCHSEKKDEVENSAVQHPVANDCGICHSPHASDQPNILKKEIYRLCTGCHENHLVNHPVDKHPLRFSKLNKESNEEISCVSCHKPHGSENQSLLKAGGGSMAVCMQCHQK
ncbi:MAG: hypothetical protein HZB59_13045 [Ignavibacteriales bacterium]|nr:hypothetical protein [Ignavibacteriales bacterium]